MKALDFDNFWKEQKLELIRLILNIQGNLDPDARVDPDDDVSGTQITISVNDNLDDWHYQTGDNSYTGSCYHHPYWGVGYIYPITDISALASELIEDLASMIAFDN